jgi:hypothetical protein
MHYIKNILERADTYVRRTRLISKSEVWMHLKVFVKLKKTLKTLSSGQKNPKKPKKPKKTQKTQKNPLGWVFLKKPGFFPTLGRIRTYLVLPDPDPINIKQNGKNLDFYSFK